MREKQRVFFIVGIVEIISGCLLIPFAASDLVSGKGFTVVGGFAALFMVAGPFLLYLAKRAR